MDQSIDAWLRLMALAKEDGAKRECIFNKPCDLLTCFKKRHCLWSDEEIKNAKEYATRNPKPL